MTIRIRKSTPPVLPARDDPEYERLRTYVLLDKHALDEAAEQQSQIYLEICDHYTEASFAAEAAEDDLARTAATMSAAVRSQLSGPKMTEGAIKESYTTLPEYVALVSFVRQKRQVAERWLNLRKAMEMRSKKMQDLTEQYSAGYFSMASATAPRRHAAEEGREALHRQRMQTQRS